MTGDDHARDDLMWSALDEEPIFEGPWLALIGVAHQVGGLGEIFGNEAPFHASGKASASPSTQTGFLDQLDKLIRLVLFDGFNGRLEPLLGVSTPQCPRVRLINRFRQDVEWFHGCTR